MLFILQDTSVSKIPSFRTGPWDHTGREHSYCRHFQYTDGSAPHWPQRRIVSQAQNQLCAPHSDSPFWCVPCLQQDSSLPLHALEAAFDLWSVHHLLIGEFGVGFRASAVAVFHPYFALLRRFLSSILVWLGQWKREGKWKGMDGLLSPFLRGRKPRVRVETMSCSLCQGDSSPPSALSSVDVELQLEAGTGFLRKEEKLGNVCWLVKKLGGFSKSLSGCLLVQKQAKKHIMQLTNKLPNTGVQISQWSRCSVFRLWRQERNKCEQHKRFPPQHNLIVMAWVWHPLYPFVPIVWPNWCPKADVLENEKAPQSERHS